MSPGIKNILRLAANVPYLNVTALATTGLKTAIAVNQKMHARWWVPFIQASATAGVKAEVLVPAGGASYLLSFWIYNAVAGHLAIDNMGVITAAASFTGAVANAGNDILVIEADIVNGSTAGFVDLQMAQAVLDAANAVTVIAGAYLETEIF